MIAPFAGALFAYLFIRLAERVKAKKEKKKSNIRALGKIQLFGNENYNSLYDTLYNIDQILGVIKLANEKSQNPFSANRLDKISIDKDIILDLQSDDFINEYFSYIILVDRHNNDVTNINHFHESMKMARLTGQITPENYNENMLRFAESLKLFRKFCVDSMERTEFIIARCRVLLKKEASFFRKIFKKNYKGYDKSFHKKYDAELLLLKKEMEEIKKSSKEKSDKIVSS
ncbi:MAG: hypothetical protein IPH62_00165 [Ignavibacteriae bacterium]|nr:hypothetical protein [Ignavibacteriota bacterium]